MRDAGLTAFSQGAWAIDAGHFSELRRLAGAMARSDVAAVQRFVPDAPDPLAYPVENGVALISIIGVLQPRDSWLGRLLGGCALDGVQSALSAAAADSAVRSIVLEIDSPGGAVAGVQQVADLIARIRGDGKRVLAWADGMCASGAYWIASAAERILVADATTMMGSIGVVATHVDESQSEAQAGLKMTEITAGRYKAVASSHKPLSEDGRATLQARVDAIYKVFVDAVATGRRRPVAEVLERMADGRVFVGHDAIKAGLADGVARLDMVMNLARPPASGANFRGEQAAAAPVVTCGAELLTTWKRCLAVRGYRLDDLTPEQGRAAMQCLLAINVDLHKEELSAGDKRALVGATEKAVRVLSALGVQASSQLLH